MTTLDAGALVREGLLHHQAGRLDEAEAAYRRALGVDPQQVDALHFLGVVEYQRGELEEAEEWITRALARNPANPPAQNNLGNVLRRQGRFDDALGRYRQAVGLDARYWDAQFNLANTLAEAGRFEQAIPAYQDALALKPASAEALSNLGNALAAVGRIDEAAARCREALALRPDFAAARCNLGNALKEQGRLDEAIAAYEAALALDPGLPNVHYNLGGALAVAGRMEEAAESLRRALSLAPEYAEARWMLAMAQLPAVPDVDASPERSRMAFERELRELEHWFDPARSINGFKAVGVLPPFYLAYQEENNRPLLERYGSLCARLMKEWLAREGLGAPESRRTDGVIRVGVVSHQFRDHSVWNAIVRGWFAQLDSGRFAIDAFHLGSDEDAETRFAKARAASFVENAGGLRGWVQAILAREPDVLIYPEIGMVPLTVRLASLRLAPVQVTTWGHPETTGLPTIDYYLSADGMEPADAQDHYRERLVRLPNLGCFYHSAPAQPAKLDPAAVGIEPGVPILLCPGVPYKYAPAHDPLFPDIARRVGRCRFVFFGFPSSEMSRRLRSRLEAAFRRARLNPADHVLFVPWQTQAAFRGLLAQATLMLDTIGFSGFNTAMQAIESGLPIVTREGRFLRGRLASGILQRIGLDELVARSDEEYAEIAARLCRDRDERESIRQRIETNRSVLFEDAAPIHALESFLTRVSGR
ncbi:MAG TPA: tetratricopeptide repeat protein [Burkholderiales bacterium]|nr:tetratricopeptide repeat protein [Burkholderiales bacterium]